MSTTSVDGLVSGLNTTQIISQLMQVEAQPQTTLKNKVQTEQNVIGAYQAVNGKLAALQTLAEALTRPTTWQAVKASSSSATVTANAGATATAGSITFDVTSLASAQVLTDVPPAAGPVTTGHGLDIGVNGAVPTNVAVTTDTPQGVVDAINAAGLGVKASLVSTDHGQVMQLSATTTGAAGAFTIGGLTNAPSLLAPGTDAKITVGTGQPGAYTISSPTNTFAEVLPGVTFSAAAVQTGVTISVTADGGGLADKMQALVDATNAALTQISTSTAYTPGSKTGSPLTGNFAVRQIQQALLGNISSGQSGYGSFQQLGVQLGSTGQLTFDRAAFLAAYQANPTTVQSAVSTGLAAQLSATAKTASDLAGGTITTAIQSGTDSIRTMNVNISDWDTRLAARQSALQLQYTNLEVALGKMKSQSSWLSGQIASLPTPAPI